MSLPGSQRVIANSVDYLIKTPKFEQLVFSSAFLFDPDKIPIIGQPRCGALYMSRGFEIDMFCRIFCRDDVVG